MALPFSFYNVATDIAKNRNFIFKDANSLKQTKKISVKLLLKKNSLYFVDFLLFTF